MTTTYNQQLGPLRSEITFTLHTQYATRLWNGRDLVKNEEGDIVTSSILSIPNALSLLSQIQQAAEQDDPYADDYLLRFEQKVLSFRKEMQEITWRMVQLYSDKIPENFQIERCANIAPIQYPIFVNTQLGYQLLYLLADFDSLARTVMTASHIAIITRQDALENNARYEAAIKRMKYTLTPDVLSGATRATFAPIIKKSSITEPNENGDAGSVEVQIAPTQAE